MVEYQSVPQNIRARLWYLKFKATGDCCISDLVEIRHYIVHWIIESTVKKCYNSLLADWVVSDKSDSFNTGGTAETAHPVYFSTPRQPWALYSWPFSGAGSHCRPADRHGVGQCDGNTTGLRQNQVPRLPRRTTVQWWLSEEVTLVSDSCRPWVLQTASQPASQPDSPSSI